MDSREAIKQRIIEKANLKANKILENADDYCLNAIKEAESDIKKQREEAINLAESKCEEIKVRREMLTRLEEKKQLLKKKQDLIESVYQKALNNFYQNKREYSRLIKQLLLSEAQNGDEVIISKEDIDLIKPIIDEVKKEKSISISLSQEYHNQKGGFILRSKRFDKRSTLTSIIERVKDSTEGEITKRLFE